MSKDEGVRLAGHLYTLLMVTSGTRQWIHLEEDGVSVASSLVPAGSDDVRLTWRRAWMEVQLRRVGRCEVCQVTRYLAPATAADLARYVGWTHLRACPRCWARVRTALGGAVLIRGAQSPIGDQPGEGGTRMLRPDARRDRFATRPDARGGSVSLSPAALAEEIGMNGSAVRWRSAHDAEGWRYELSLAVPGEAPRRWVRCMWDRRAGRWVVQQDAVAWVRNRVDLRAVGDNLEASQGSRSEQRYPAGLVWRVLRGSAGRLQVSLPHAPGRTWGVGAEAMDWCDVPPTHLELRTAELFVLDRTRGPISRELAGRILRHGRALRYVFAPPDGGVIALEPFREWADLHQGQFPALATDEALLACASGMLRPETQRWPRDYAAHCQSYLDGVAAVDEAEMREHTALYQGESRSIEAAMAALAAVGLAAGGTP